MDSLFSTMASASAGDVDWVFLTGPEDQSTLIMGSQTLYDCTAPGLDTPGVDPRASVRMVSTKSLNGAPCKEGGAQSEATGTSPEHQPKGV